MLNTLKSLPLTFYSRTFYSRLVHQWQGIGMGFVTVLMLLGLINAAIALYLPLRETAGKVQAVMNAMPDATIKNHTLSIDRSVPYTVDVFDSGGTPNKLVIDTTYTNNDIDALNSYINKQNIFVFVTATKLVTRKQNELRIDNFQSLPDGTFGHDKWVMIGNIFQTWIYPCTLLLSAIGLFIANFILVFFAAIVVKILAALMSVKTDFGGAMRLAGASGIPPAVFILFVTVNFWIKVAIWICYAVFALSALLPPRGAPEIKN